MFRYSYVLLMLYFFCTCKKDIAVAPLAQTDGKTGMLTAVNILRQTGCKCGIDSMSPAPALIWSDILSVAANKHAKDMFTNNYFSHISLTGTIPLQRAIAAGYTGTSILENIATGYINLPDVINAWKNSETHCKAMMNKEYIEMGAARANQYWVQEFGK